MARYISIILLIALLFTNASYGFSGSLPQALRPPLICDLDFRIRSLISEFDENIWKPYKKEMDRLWFPDQGTYEWYNGDKIIDEARRNARDMLVEFCDKFLKDKDAETLKRTAELLEKEIEYEIKKSKKRGDDGFGKAERVAMLRNMLLFIAHTVYNPNNISCDINKFMSQEAARDAVVEALSEIAEWGINKIAITKSCLIKGEFKNGSSNKVYLVESNMPVEKIGDIAFTYRTTTKINGVETVENSPVWKTRYETDDDKRWPFLIITDTNDNILQIAVKWERRLKEDESDKFFILQDSYTDAEISEDERQNILRLKGKIEALFTEYLNKGEEITQRPYYVHGPMIQRGFLETGQDKELKEFLNTNPIAQHILSLPEFQGIERISFSPGMYTVEKEFDYHGNYEPSFYGTLYNLPAGYYVYHKGAVLCSLFDRPLYLSPKILAIHEMLHHLTRLRYNGFMLPQFEAQNEKIGKHIKENHPDAWKKLYDKPQSIDYDEFLNTLVGYFAVNINVVEILIHNPYGKKSDKQLVINETIKPSDILFLEELGLIPHKDVLSKKWPHGINKGPIDSAGRVSSFSRVPDLNVVIMDILVKRLGSDFAKWWVYHALKAKARLCELKDGALPSKISTKEIKEWSPYRNANKLFSNGIPDSIVIELGDYGYRYNSHEDSYILEKASNILSSNAPDSFRGIDEIIGTIKEPLITIPNKGDATIYKPHSGRGQGRLNSAQAEETEAFTDAASTLSYLLAYNSLIQEPTVKNFLISVTNPDTETGPYDRTMFYALNQGISEEFLTFLHIGFWIRWAIFSYYWKDELKELEPIDLWMYQRVLEQFCLDNYPNAQNIAPIERAGSIQELDGIHRNDI